MENPAYRPKWDHYYMAMAHMVAERSTCDRLRAGSVLVKDNRVIGTGYNGSPPGMEHCDDVGHLMHENHCIRTLHGEENTLLQAARLGIIADASTIYTTYSPCYHCLKKLIATGVKRIVAGQIYRDERVFTACEEAGVEFVHYTPDADWLDYLASMYKDMPREKIEEVKTANQISNTDKEYKKDA
ncbi:dCMP deaminase [Candidatus Uhrbacteria bacterium CG_4_10_14_0_2_um_filter_41_7]|uniref:dCMP deaminase n=1 Tax=Candidatus Uhrbacteria bacterium CG_4_9_14_3_um_filter_41_35 TaxID=1975034 RepID=A0A2M7XFW2_9BACT|nr:MAG: dCMP deaminase [Candidatus Uhrbacteria bacterium CG11_big_fil_rev_8_21_14_0_20_41_9]PIZ54590.1 MAG: dCMP deaminase [Candidatus Uhrbacteria bacterium CG_4_10_14_0_2_um_filter_41_7]PJA46751.1 MAG: dCMP deaminase [Candidatus Uhrbacteria bacterium CG_4_9_14_3_um_filter_41_35]